MSDHEALRARIAELEATEAKLREAFAAKCAELAFAIDQRTMLRGESVWWWQDDGGNDVESLSCLVVFSADQVRAMIKQQDLTRAERDEARRFHTVRAAPALGRTENAAAELFYGQEWADAHFPAGRGLT